MNIDWNTLLTGPNIFFFTCIVLCLISGLIKGGGSRSSLVNSLPGMAISFGILGTFTGIFIGLMDFNENEISKSIPLMLGGMKTAFATSLGGMLTSIILKAWFSIRDDNSLIASDDPIKSLQKIESAIVSCFKSDEEYSLVSQVKLIRQELIDGRRETKVAFQEFADQFSKMASESLVNELQKVVDKFNTMLNDLVNESFKELTESTIRLNEWQNEYQITIKLNQTQLQEMLEHITQLHQTFTETASRLQEADKTFESIDKSLTAISTSGTELDEHSKALSNQNALLEASITSIRDIGIDAQKVVPEISDKMTKIISDISALQNSSNLFVTETTNKLESGVDKITSTLVETSEAMQNTTKDFVEKTTNELKADYDHLSKSTQEHVVAIEKSLEKELTNSLNSLAGALTALSNQFVSDYAPLTEKLREVVAIAEASRVHSN